MKVPRPRRKRKTVPPAQPDWSMRLYIAGHTPRSVAAFRNLEQLCKDHLAGRYRIEVIDLTKHPQLAQDDQIVAVPALVRTLPSPTRKIIGDLSNTERVRLSLDLPPHNSSFARRNGEKNV
ncbi:MAG: circadian clock KaiB family protein [Chthoniobacterales bacterium]